jgi:16S rRNA (cytosine967-C5)-methyltransferase
MNIRQIALRILDEYETGGKYINLALSSHLTDGLSREEKAALTALLYTTVERKLSYDYYILSLSKRSEGDIDIHTKNILRLGLCQLLDMRSIPDYAAVNETVKLTRGQGERAFVNGVLRAASRQKDSLPMPDEKKKALRFLSVKYSFPLATVRHFNNLYGREATEEILRFYNEEKYTDITVNTTKISVVDYQSSLASAGIFAEENESVQGSLRIFGSVNPEGLPGFGEGHFFVQDRASAISAQALSPNAGDLIVDVCAAPGGKSLAAAINTADMAEIHSFDLHDSKLSLIEKSAQRLGIDIISVAERDARSPDEKLLGTADRVLCDVPCSGLGVMAKKPEIRYKKLADFERLPEIQLEILEKSSAYVKVGGVLVYSTCTVLPEENEQNVKAFLSSHPEFEPVDFCVGGKQSENGMMSLSPDEDGMDGFFIAKMMRRA